MIIHSRSDRLRPTSATSNPQLALLASLKSSCHFSTSTFPPHLHFRQPSPHIPWSEYPLSVTANGKPWPRAARPRLAGVSSFGFSGTNVHVVIEEAPQTVPSTTAVPQRPLHCLPLSARSETALAQLAQRYAESMGTHPDVSLVDVAQTVGAGRSHFDRRVAVVAETMEGGYGGTLRLCRGRAAFGGASGHGGARSGSRGGVSIHRPGLPIPGDESTALRNITRFSRRYRSLRHAARPRFKFPNPQVGPVV